MIDAGPRPLARAQALSPAEQAKKRSRLVKLKGKKMKPKLKKWVSARLAIAEQLSADGHDEL